MDSFEYRLTTRATPEQALAFLGDLHNLPRFIAEVTRVDATGADAYEVGFDRGFFIPDLVVDYAVERPPGSTGPLAQRLAQWRAGGIEKELARELDAVA
jgi:hypothetical protein